MQSSLGGQDMLRLIIGVVVGFIVSNILVTIAEFTGMKAYPPPPGLDPNNMAQMTEIIRRMPVNAMIYVLVGWTFGAFCGPAVAVLIANRRALAGWIVGGVFFCLTLFNLMMFPGPVWFRVAAVVLEVAAIAAAVLLLRRKALAPA